MERLWSVLYQPNVTIVGIMHSILYDIENTQEILCRRSKINKTPRHLCVPLLGGGVCIRELFFCFLMLEKKLWFCRSFYVTGKKNELSTVCYQFALPEFPKIITQQGSQLHNFWTIQQRTIDWDMNESLQHEIRAKKNRIS